MRIIHNSRFLFILIALIFIALILCGCVDLILSQSSTPRVVTPDKVPQVISQIPSYTEFGYSGVSYFNNKLYVSSNIGLLEYENKKLARLYKWYDRDDVVLGPWLGKAGRSLFIHHNGLNRLIEYDGKTWQSSSLPQPREGYSRGDMLAGIEIIGNNSGVWFQASVYAWRFDEASKSWIEEKVPNEGLFYGILPLEKNTFFIMRHIYTEGTVESPMNNPNKPNSDAIYFLQNGKWQEIKNQAGNFYKLNAIATKDAGYILTDEGALLQVTSSEIVPIESLGVCEVMTKTTSGNLLVSFRGKRNLRILKWMGEKVFLSRSTK